MGSCTGTQGFSTFSAGCFARRLGQGLACSDPAGQPVSKALQPRFGVLAVALGERGAEHRGVDALHRPTLADLLR